MPTPILVGPEIELVAGRIRSLTALANGSFVTTTSTVDVGGVGNVYTHKANGSFKSVTLLNDPSSSINESRWSTSALIDGGFAVSWSEEVRDPNTDLGWRFDIKTALYNANGSARTGAILVSSELAEAQNATITTLSNGTFAVFYTSEASDSNDVFVRMFASNGTPLGASVQVNTAKANGQDMPAAVGLKNGSLAVVYEDDSNIARTTIRAKIITNGNQSAEFEISDLASGGGVSNQNDPQIAALADGRFVVTWTDNTFSASSKDGGGGSVLGRIYNADGSAATGSFVVNTTTAWHQGYSSVTALKNGGFAVAYMSDSDATGIPDEDGDIHVQVFNAAGQRDGAEVRVNTTTRGTQTNPVTTDLGDGRLVVSWDDQPLKTAYPNVRYQILDPRGSSVSLDGTAGADEFMGTAGADRLKGQGGNDVLDGVAGNDTIYGDAGNDQLFGGLGNDKLYGGLNKDTFVFNTATNKRTNVDKIYDFKSKDDSIWLDNAIFTKLGRGTDAGVKFKSKMFKEGAKATDRDDRIVYDKKSGSLYYDQDGSGSKAQVKIATISNKTKLYYHDFFVI